MHIFSLREPLRNSTKIGPFLYDKRDVSHRETDRSFLKDYKGHKFHKERPLIICNKKRPIQIIKLSSYYFNRTRLYTLVPQKCTILSYKNVHFHTTRMYILTMPVFTLHILVNIYCFPSQFLDCFTVSLYTFRNPLLTILPVRLSDHKSIHPINSVFFQLLN